MTSDYNGNQPQITLYRGWLDRGRYVWSPFVVKLEARLRFAGVKYRTEVGSTGSAPNGKIPYIELAEGSDGGVEALGDSTLIIKYLMKRGVIEDLNGEGRLAGEERARDLALRALLEDKLYFYHTRERWTENYYTMRDHILQSLPFPMRVLVGLLIHRNTVKTLHGQGTGRFTKEEMAAFKREIWESIVALLTSSKQKATGRVKSANGEDLKKPFWVLGGEEPTDADTTLFGFIVSVLVCTACPDSHALVKSFPILLEYAERIHDWYFPDYEKWT